MCISLLHDDIFFHEKSNNAMQLLRLLGITSTRTRQYVLKSVKKIVKCRHAMHNDLLSQSSSLSIAKKCTTMMMRITALLPRWSTSKDHHGGVDFDDFTIYLLEQLCRKKKKKKKRKNFLALFLVLFAAVTGYRFLFICSFDRAYTLYRDIIVSSLTTFTITTMLTHYTAAVPPKRYVYAFL